MLVKGTQIMKPILFAASHEANLYPWTILSQSQSYIRPTVNHPLSWCQAPIWDPWPIVLLFSLIIFKQLCVCWCGVPSLMRGRVCSFHFLLGIASTVFLGSESHGTHEHILLSLFWDPPAQPGGLGSCIYFLQEQGSPVIPHTLSLSN
jgi:hypothetical protein